MISELGLTPWLSMLLMTLYGGVLIHRPHLLALLLFSLVAFAADDEDWKTLRARESQAYSVRVNGVQADLLAQQTMQLHGSGFVIELSETRGRILTNRHVVHTASRIAGKFNQKGENWMNVPDPTHEELPMVEPYAKDIIIRASGFFDEVSLKLAEAKRNFDPSEMGGGLHTDVLAEATAQRNALKCTAIVANGPRAPEA
jgi:hypothetical protein